MYINNIIIISVLLVSFCGAELKGHAGHDHPAKVFLPIWTVNGQNEKVEGSFLLFKDGLVWLEKKDHSSISYPLNAFSKEDQSVILAKVERIKSINRQVFEQKSSLKATNNESGSWLYLIIFTVFLGVLVVIRHSKVLAFGWLSVGVLFFWGFRHSLAGGVPENDPLVMDQAFIPFKPDVNTFWDSKYFYIESHGIPDHEMMTGIVKWQQQVPIPQCYIGTNAWPIPLKPELAVNPVPVNDQHFLRGAVAVATNGVAIFNPHTNTGVDALEDGQLDDFGGHSGRADDYHYHIAPLHLDSKTEDVLPIAYALDGFAIYGPLEPDGQPMKPLDGNHGHFAPDGSYHYHGTKEKPYMIGNMVGKVTEDNTMQIIPQAAAKGVRPALTPLNGAAITDCTPNATNNGYVLTYTKGGLTYKVDYSWTAVGKYTFHFISPTGTTTSVYNGFVPCSIASATDESTTFSMPLVMAPNPALTDCFLSGLDENQWKSLQKMEVFNSQGQSVLTKEGDFREFSVAGFSKGTYLIHFSFTNGKLTKKLIVQ